MSLETNFVLFTKKIEKVADAAILSIKEQIDLESEIFVSDLKKNTPKNSQELINSITVKKIDDGIDYGYDIEYVGEHSSGVNNEALANILNYGSSKTPGTYFRSKAISKLKGIDKRITLRYEKKVKDLKD